MRTLGTGRRTMAPSGSDIRWRCPGCTRSPLRRGRSALDVEAAVELAVELDKAAHRLEWHLVLLAIEGGEHARVVVDRRNRRAQTLAERLADGAPAQVLLAARPGRLRNDLQLTRIGLELEDREAYEVLFGHAAASSRRRTTPGGRSSRRRPQDTITSPDLVRLRRGALRGAAVLVVP